MSVQLRVTRVILVSALLFYFIVLRVWAQNDQLICGKRQVNVEFLLLHGNTSDIRWWPWHATIYHQINEKEQFVCGGCIVDSNTILTVGHCLFSHNRLLRENEISVHVGRGHLNEESEYVQKLSVVKFMVHPEFKVHGIANDIAVIKLTSDISWSPFVQPVCLWSMDDIQFRIEGHNGTVVGFGMTERNAVSETLQEALLTVVDVHTCMENDESYPLVLKRDMFCAGGNARASACNGDSGGGIYFAINNIWYVRGLVSSVAKQNDAKCDGSKFTIFTDVSKYREWILRFSAIKARWIENLEPCKDRFVKKGTMCNMANHFRSGFLLGIHPLGVTPAPISDGQGMQHFYKSKSVGMDRDCTEGRVYWIEYEMKQIFSAKYDGTDRKPFITNDIVWPWGVAVDWISRRLYWADDLKRTIEVATLDNPRARITLINNLVDAWGLAVDPYQGKLFWGDWSHGTPHIEWANLDGTERQILTEKLQMTRPYSIQVSMLSGELCYADKDTQQVECIDTYNKQVRTMASNLTTLPSILTMTDGMFYMADLLTKNMASNEHQKPIIMSERLVKITPVTDWCPVFYSPCAVNNGGCPRNTICFVLPSASSGKSCTRIK